MKINTTMKTTYRLQVPIYSIISIIHFAGNKAKDESQNGCFEETKDAKFSDRKTNISYPLMRTRS